MERKTKACPFCGEEILETAKKCKHCGEMIKTEEELEEEKNFKPLVYGKNKAVKFLTCFVWWLFTLWFFITGSTVSSDKTTIDYQVNENWETVEVENIQEWENGGIFYLLGLLCLIPIAQMFSKKFILDKDHVTIKKGIVFKKKENIQYSKMNNVEQSEFLGFWGVRIFTWNDKPTVFSNLQDYEAVVNFLQKKINR